MIKSNSSVKKYSTYGHVIGILMQEHSLIRMPGDVGNATTFKFPVKYKVVKNIDPEALKNPKEAMKYADCYIKAAQELESEGVRAIVGGCGFMSIYQQEMTQALDIPVFTSSLLQVPIIHSTFKKEKKVGIVTANSRCLTEIYFNKVGWSTKCIPVTIVGIEKMLPRLSSLLKDSSEESINETENALAELMVDFIKTNHDIGAIVLECTNLPPYSYAIQKAVNLPIFDVVTLAKWVYSSVISQKYYGYL